MSTRMYFSQGTAAPGPLPAPSVSDWEHINSVSRKLLQAPDMSVLTTVSYQPDAADDLTNGDSMFRQFLSDPLEAQTLDGSFNLQLQCVENTANNNVFLVIKVIVVDKTGTAVNTLLGMTRDDTEAPTTAVANRSLSASMGSYSCADGDRLLLEIGLGGTPTAGAGVNGHNGGIRFGCDASSGDLPADDTETGLTYRGYIEFTSTFQFKRTAKAMHQYRLRRQ